MSEPELTEYSDNQLVESFRSAVPTGDIPAMSRALTELHSRADLSEDVRSELHSMDALFLTFLRARVDGANPGTGS